MYYYIFFPVAAIVIWSFCCVFVIFEVVLCVMLIKWIRRAKQNQSHPPAFVAHPPAPSQNNVYHQYQLPQVSINQPTYSNYDLNPYHNTTPAYLTTNPMEINQMYAGQPSIMQPAPLISTPLAPPVYSHPVTVQKEMEVSQNRINI